ncbi:MAG: Flp pilus assembly protein CpaB [Burkholderiales bacterium]|nr:Flp pilus assembly protein CpaB [Burkholderiales bacterium]OJX08751.1 MAG: Flp pilus assembly protein CpaB [Burkholderiales bacterium 70-64]
MKGTRAMVMLLLSLVAGIAAVVLAARWLGEQGSAAGGAQVVIASRDIELGQPLNASMVSVVPWPAGSVPEGAFAKVEAIDGRVLRTQILKGEPVLEAKLAPVGTKGGLSAVIGQGRRAITVKVNEVVGVAGFALPGNYVDVLVNTQDDRDRPVSKIVLERILVLAVAQEASRDDTKPRVVNAVTLEVTPEQAERIDLARSVGNLSLVLRNQIDQNQAGTGGVRKAELLGMASFEPPAAPAAAPAPASAPPPRPRPRVYKPVAPPVAAVPKEDARVEVIRGVQRSSTDL